MTLDEFRINHSTLIEHYQFIEAHLEGIYARISDADFYQGIKEVEKHNIRRLLGEIKRLDKMENRQIFTEEEYNLLDTICDRRNFWCHNCYYDLVFDRKTQGPKKDKDVAILKRDIQEAEKLRDMLYQKYTNISCRNDGILY